MSSESIIDQIAQQEWTQPIEDSLQKAVAGAFASGDGTGRKAEDFLHGKWLGHPLHPVLTDVPVGSWTAATVFDLADAMDENRYYAAAADACVTVGLVGAVGSAITGLTDWHQTDGKARRIGLVHGLLNLTATALYATSLVLRKRKQREAARVCSWLGYAVAFGSAYLGGYLVYNEKIGTDHTDKEGLPEEFVPVMQAADLPENTLRRVEADGKKILLVRQGERIYALAEVCAHLGGPLAEGTLEGNTVRCPWHGSCYSLEDGRVLEGPSVFNQPCLEMRVRDGQIEVRFAPAPALGATRHAESPSLTPAPSNARS